MKTVLQILLQILKWVLIAGLLLFSVATFMGGAYLQTIVVILAATSLAWWPSILEKKWNRSVSVWVRSIWVVLLILSNVIIFRPDPKSSIYLSEELQKELMEIYDRKVDAWPGETESIYILTSYGKVHVLATGSDELPPLVMIHAASMGAHSWAENLAPLLGHYRIYSIDNIGEGNRSKLNDPLVYPNSQKEIADHLKFILDELGVHKAPFFGASNGGFVAMCFASHYPEQVESLALFGPMGLTRLTGKSIMMLSIATMYPFQFIRDRVSGWAIGTDEYVRSRYGDWFNGIMKATMASVAQPVPMTSGQKASMEMPVLLFLGTEDQIVGDARYAAETARYFPNIRVEVLESSHLIAVEKAAMVNPILKEFLGI